MSGRQRSLQELVRRRLAYAFLSLADCFLSLFPESKATKHLSPHSCFSVVELSSGGKIPQVMGRKFHPGRQAGTFAILLPWVACPSLDLVPTWRACWAVLVLTSDFGREEEMNNKEHHGNTDQPQTSWVPLPLGEDEALSPRMLCHQTGGRDLGNAFSIPAWGWHQQLHRICKRGWGFHLASKYKAWTGVGDSLKKVLSDTTKFLRAR